MKSKVKSIVCMLLAIVMMSSVFAISANAATDDEENVEIVFYKPDSWGNDIHIHLWNAENENTQWPGASMTQNSNGTYTYSSTSITSCNFVVNDNNGNQTSDLYANGYVGVKNNCVFKMSKDSIYLYFEKPSDWSSNVRAYYYTNDNNKIALTQWPGKAMSKNYGEDTYYLRISDMADARVIFTDGTHQYPPANQEGIAVTADNDLIFENGKYTTVAHNWFSLETPRSYAIAGEEFEVDITMELGDDFPLFFEDENNTILTPVRSTQTRHNGKVNCKYFFVFNEAGTKTIDTHYIYESSYGTARKPFDVIVYDSITGVDFNDYLNCDKQSVNVGDTFTLTANNHSELNYYFYDEDGNQLTCDSITYNYPDYTTSYHFTANKIGKDQKIYMYSSHYHAPDCVGYTGRYITIDVWQSAN